MKNENEETPMTWKDVIAITLALYQLIFPWVITRVLALVIILLLVRLLF